jgi:hypothetical protein
MKYVAQAHAWPALNATSFSVSLSLPPASLFSNISRQKLEVVSVSIVKRKSSRLTFVHRPFLNAFLYLFFESDLKVLLEILQSDEIILNANNLGGQALKDWPQERIPVHNHHPRSRHRISFDPLFIATSDLEIVSLMKGCIYLK